MDTKAKREREKETVSQMIAIYCRKQHGAGHFAPTVPRWMPMPGSEATNAPLWKRKHSVPIAVSTATGQICVRRSGR